MDDTSARASHAANLLLLSNSRSVDGTYLGWARTDIAAFLGAQVSSLLFIPYATVPAVRQAYEAYAERVRNAFAELGYGVVSLHECTDPVKAVQAAEVIVVGGGNTFHLLAQLYSAGLVDLIAARVRAGARYIGWSAGSVIACPTIATTNDMPIIEPRSLRALNLVPFQINAHFTDVHPPGHQGETRAERIAEFLKLQPALTVIGLREGCLLRVSDADVRLGGTGGRIFRAGSESLEWTVADGSLADVLARVPS